jgi:8-oxo-dGTP diphosphatase
MKQVAVGVLLREGRVLACQRKEHVHYPLKWEFPGGKIEEGESARQAVIRELKEELEIDAQPDGTLLTHEWIYPGDAADPASESTFRITYFIVHHFSGELDNRAFREIRWVFPEELQAMDVLAGNREAIKLLLQRRRQDGSPL